MILSNEDLFCAAQAVTATVASTNCIDLGAAGTVYGAASTLAIDRGKGKKTPPLLVQVVEGFVGGTSVAVSMETDDNSAFSSPKTVATTGAIPTADLVAGYQFSIDDIPLHTSERYVQLRFTPVGTFTAGKITAGFTLGNQTN